jgi:hypothetical protein
VSEQLFFESVFVSEQLFFESSCKFGVKIFQSDNILSYATRK